MTTYTEKTVIYTSFRPAIPSNEAYDHDDCLTKWRNEG